MSSQPEIFYVLNSRWPTIKAYGLQVAKTCQGIKRAGGRVRLIVPIRARHHEIRGMDPFELYGISDHFRLIRILSADFTRWHMSGRFLFWVQQFLFAGLTAAVLTFRQGIVYTRDPLTAYLLSFVRQNIFWEAHRIPEHPNGSMYRRLLHKLSGIIVISTGIREAFIGFGADPHRVEIIPDAVDVGEFDVPQTTAVAREQLSLPGRGPLIGYIGQLTTLGKEKGVDDLFRAFKRVFRHNPSASLVVVGGSPQDLTKYQSLASTLGMANGQIIFAGHQPYRSIPLYARAMDVLIMPFPDTPHYARSMSPLKLFEYLAALKPVVATDLPSVREVVGDDEVFFARPGDSDSLAKCIEQALNDTEAADRRISRVRALLPSLDWKTRGEHILAFVAAHTTN